MQQTKAGLSRQIVNHARHSLSEHHLPRIKQCLAMLSTSEIWWRPHKSSNSIGNLVLHLSGNVRQWIVSGLGRQKDTRQRDLEFAARGPIPRRALVALLQAAVAEACIVISKLTTRDLEREFAIQGYRVTGLQALLHVIEHFSHHSGQIILLTKMKRRLDLGFTRLPGDKRRQRKGRNLPAI